MQHKPLKDIRILEIGGYIAAPYATSLLCSLGADVVKVEKPGEGDAFRRQLNERSPYFIQYNSGKRSLGVDLKAADGIALVKSLIPRFDVILENLRPGKMDAIGLSHEECARLRPDLIYASVTGFGNGGPLQQRPAYDTIGQAFGGLISCLSDEGAAQISGTCLADLITGVTNAAGILAALVGRASTGSGHRVETSMMEAVSALTIDAVTQYVDMGHRDPTRRSRHPQAQNFCVQAASGEEIAIHLSSSVKFWFSFISAMDRRDLDDDPRFATFALRQENYADLAEIVEAEFAKRPAAEWEALLDEFDVPFAPVLGMSGYINHPQTKWLDIIGPEANGVALVRPPWRFDGVRPERAPAAPRVGQDTRKIAAEVLDEVRIEELLARGVLFTDD